MRLGFLQEFTSKASWDSLGKTGGEVDEVMKGSDCAFSRSQLLVRTIHTVKRSLKEEERSEFIYSNSHLGL